MPEDNDNPAVETDGPQDAAGAHATTRVTQQEPEAPAAGERAHGAKARGHNGPGRLASLCNHLLQGGLRDEDTKQAALVMAWVKKRWNDDEIKRTFIETEWQARLVSYRKKARLWRIAQVSIWLLIAVLGLLISVFAGFKSGQGFTIVAGALVATLTTLTNATHPGRQADGYHTARQELRDEGWCLLNHAGDYAKPSEDDRYAHFVDQIDKIVQSKRASTNLGSLTP